MATNAKTGKSTKKTAPSKNAKPQKAAAKNTPSDRGRRVAARAAAALCALAALLLVWMYAQSLTVHLQYADVYLNDLPASFDGATVLFVSDLHMDAHKTPGRTFHLMQNLASLAPDMVLIGGDFASLNAADLLLSLGSEEKLAERNDRRRAQIAEFAALMAHFPAPLGKYAVAGEDDIAIPELSELLGAGGITLLGNDLRRIERGGDEIVIAGIDSWSAGTQNLAAIAGAVDAADCVLLLTHEADALPALNNQPSRDGGRTADLVFAGHTHGGQVRLFGKRLYGSSIYGERYFSGWYLESGTHMLISNGVGAAFLPLRLGAPAQAHLITLRRAENAIFS